MHIHIIGIAGTMTAPLAVWLKKQGNIVTGSDQAKIYPPISTILSKAKIYPNSKLKQAPDLVIVGSSYKAFQNTKQEYLQFKAQKIPLISATKYIAKFVSNKNTILVAGSFGKTTITSLVSWVLINANLNPSYMFGGQSLNKISPLSINKSQWSVIEADESVNGLDSKAKFLYYPVNHLILTSADWEHKESYSSESQNLAAFQQLISRVPQKGLIVFNQDNSSLSQIIPKDRPNTYSYGPNLNADFCIQDQKNLKHNTQLKIKTPQKTFLVKTKLLGQFNYQNILAAFTLTYLLGINPKIITKSISSYRGIKRRLEIVSQVKDTVFIDDFAQSPKRVKASIQAISNRYPQHQISVIFEPHASFLSYQSGIKDFSDVFDIASEVILTKIPFKPNIDKQERVNAKDFQQTIGAKLKYLPLDSQIIDLFSKSIGNKQIIIHFSSGGLSGLKTFREIIKNYKKANTQ